MLTDQSADTDVLFGGKTDDTESDLVHFTYRSYGAPQGRWFSPDPYDGSVDPLDPQTLNRYAYVNNDPLSLMDPLGLAGCNKVGSGYSTDSNGNVSAFLQEGCGGFLKAIENFFEAIGRGFRFGNPIGPLPKLPPPSQNGPDPCADSNLAATAVNASDNISQADRWIGAGYVLGDSLGGSGFLGGLVGYGLLVNTGGPQDVKSQGGSGTPTQLRDAGNISYGITCPLDDSSCTFFAGAAQTVLGHGPDPDGTASTGYDSPADTKGIQRGQQMKHNGCHH